MRTKITGRALRGSALAASLSLLAAVASSADEGGAFIPQSRQFLDDSRQRRSGIWVWRCLRAGRASARRYPLHGRRPGQQILNNSANAQGLGTTIIQLSPRGTLAPPGAAATFFSSSLPGLSTALGVLRRGFVVVGNVPTTDGTFNTIGQGATTGN